MGYLQGPGPSSAGKLGAAPTETPVVTVVVTMVVEGTIVVGMAVVAETAEVAPVGGMTVEAAEVAETTETGTTSEAVVVGSATMEAGVVGCGLGAVSKEAVPEATLCKVGLDKAGSTEEPEARPVTPLIAQFGEDDSWWRKMVDFVRREADGDARDPPDYWRDQIPQDEVQAEVAQEAGHIGGEAVKAGVEPGPGSSSFFSYEDSEEEFKETVSKMRPEVGSWFSIAPIFWGGRSFPWVTPLLMWQRGLWVSCRSPSALIGHKWR